MSRLVDPTICPDCRASLDTEARCTECRTRFAGEDAVDLWRLMHEADGLVERLRRTSRLEEAMAARRAASVAAAAPTSGPIPAAGSSTGTAVLPPVAPSRPSGPPEVPPVPPGTGARPPTPRRLPALSVPVVLLSLGGLCLLVAAVVFVAVTWGSLGLTGRTLVLLGVTGMMAGLATVLTRRGLRGAAETCWTVVAGMLTLDLLAAESAGLAGLDALSWRELGVLVGVALFTLGAGVGLWARRTPVRELLAPQVVALLGAVGATAAGAWLAADAAVGATLAVPLLTAAALPLLQRLPRLGWSLVALVGATWLELVADGLFRATETSDLGPWWADARGWPLLAAAAFAAAATVSGRLPERLRPVGAALALAPLAVLVNAPATPGAQTRDTVLRCATLLALAGLVRLAPRTWALGAGALAGLGVLGLGLQLVVTPWTALTALPVSGAADLAVPPYPFPAASWSYAAIGLAIAAALVAAPRLVPPDRDEDAHAAVRALARVLAAGALVVGVAAAVTGARPPLWLAVAVLLLGSLLATLTTWVVARRSGTAAAVAAVAAVGGLLAAYLALVTLVAARPSDLLTGVAATVLAVALAVACALAERAVGADEDGATTDLVAAATGVLAVLTGAYAVAAWCGLADADGRTTSLVLVAYAAAAALLAHPATRRTPARVAVELGAAGPVLAAAGIAPDPGALATVLTVGGTTVAVVAALHRDRAPAAWGALGLLGLATLVRLDAGPSHVAELSLLPATLVLVLGGLGHRRGRQAGSRAAAPLLGAGVGTGYVLGLAVATRAPLDAFSAVEASLVALAAAALVAVLERGTTTWASGSAAALSVLLGGLAVTGWCDVVAASAATTALALAAYASLALLLAAPLTREPHTRLAVEAAAGLVALGALAGTPDDANLALVLSLLGSAVALLAVLRRDRDLAGWAAMVLLTGAAVVGVDAGLPAPELYLGPAIVLLTVHGLAWLRHHGTSGTRTTLGSGLTLGYVAVLALVAQRPGDVRAVVSSSVLLAALAGACWLLERRAAPFAGPAAGVLVAMAGAVSTDAWTQALDTTTYRAILAQAVWAAAVGVLASPAGRQVTTRLALEGTAAVLAVASAVAAPDGTTLAAVLTVVGSAVAVVSVTNRDRTVAGWLGAVLLGLATAVRLAVDVPAPELYTLPAALLLIGAGVWRLRTDAASSSLAALGSGLTLALLPSLLLALEEPLTLRGALVGAGGVAVLAYGVRARLAAPFVLGAATTAALAVRHLQPVDAALPRWVSLAVLGLALLVVGITWEARLRNLQAARRYLTGLR